MPSVHSCCKVSPGQILSLPLSSMALIPVASGHSQACRKKSPMHHWRRADTPPPRAAKINRSPSPCIVCSSVSLSGNLAASLAFLPRLCLIIPSGEPKHKSKSVILLQEGGVGGGRGSCRGHSKHLVIACAPLLFLMQTWRDEEIIPRSGTGEGGFAAAVASPPVSWAELLHYTKLHAAVSKWLPPRFLSPVSVSVE